MKKLLIIDDDVTTRRLLLATFEHDYDIFQATDGTNGLNMVFDHRPDLVILDGKMPRLDGLVVLKAIKSNPELANTLVVMLTGRGQFADLEKGVNLGADAYFIKPFSPKTLRAWVMKNLQSAVRSGIAPAVVQPSA